MTASSGDLQQRVDGLVIKVIEALDGGEAFLGRLPNGNTARFSLGQRADIGRGSVVYVGDDFWEVLPDTAWSEIPEVAIVRRIIEDGLLIEYGAGIRYLAGNPSVDVAVGNTVQFSEVDGITRVLDQRPVRYRDEGTDDGSLDEYLIQPDGDGPTFASFAGYHDVRRRAVELIETQLQNREQLAALGARPVKGVIFTGPPGTGKTHLARVIAHESGAAFYLVSGPSIVSKWVGDSEQAIRRIFRAAAKHERGAIVFFDEIDSIAERRTEESHEASRRLVAQLLTELDGFDQSTANLVVIAATNRIESVDEALLRPGRFDWEIAFGMPTYEDRLEILRLGASQMTTDGALSLEKVAAASDGWSAARLSSLWTEAALLAAADKRKAIVDEDVAQAFERVAGRPVREVRRETNGA
ncbi:ATP-binding protein [Nesterenkonia sp. CL21]|uniref:ATP-binding protein n=1 Tax=Nesterenkonia sp. CL21 TaxID=3064894 RepID=UPI00287A05D6|nr:ATP-binding protein [Nesterenkonia sp. CL21]MDS2171346.1 ATP-binding protein [Nesterenkonia sp. CL21]